MEGQSQNNQQLNLTEAAKLVNAAIAKERERLKKIAATEEADPVLVEGETSTGYCCHIQVNPKEVAAIALRHDWPVWVVLGEDFPDAMWAEFANHFGLGAVDHVDL